MNMKSLAQSHKLQSEGVDYQEAANTAAEEAGITFESIDYNELCSSNGPGCNCPFCALAYVNCDGEDYELYY